MIIIIIQLLQLPLQVVVHLLIILIKTFSIKVIIIVIIIQLLQLPLLVVAHLVLRFQWQHQHHHLILIKDTTSSLQSMLSKNQTKLHLLSTVFST